MKMSFHKKVLLFQGASSEMIWDTDQGLVLIENILKILKNVLIKKSQIYVCVFVFIIAYPSGTEVFKLTQSKNLATALSVKLWSSKKKEWMNMGNGARLE